jgi:glycosyltransferase involved in cell wall biosynthesis
MREWEGYYHEDLVDPEVTRALSLAIATENILLLEKIIFSLKKENRRVPLDVEQYFLALCKKMGQGLLLRWLGNETSQGDEETDHKIERLAQMIQELSSGNSMFCCVCVPALNEEEALPKLIKSIREQISEFPICVVVSDNGSTDKTREVALSEGANVVSCSIPGIGPARNTAIDFCIRNTPTSHDRTLIIQTDADCILEDKFFIQKVAECFKANQDILVSTGVTNYQLNLEDGQQIKVSGGRQFASFFGTKGLREYFELCDKDIQEYLISHPYRYLIGPNTVFRASIFNSPTIRFPDDKSWESLVISIRIQQFFSSIKHITSLENQRVISSSRAILNGSSSFTAQRSEELQELGYIPPMKAPDTTSPFQTVRSLIRKIDEETYSLECDEEIIAEVTYDSEEEFSRIEIGDTARIEKSKHASLLFTLSGKAYVIGKR